MRISLIIIMCIYNINAYGQGKNNTWLLGHDTGFTKARIVFDSLSYNLIVPDNRQMTFWGTQATISDEFGNLLMSSNGVWIENANNDTMQNGSGLNPGNYVNTYPNGLLITYGNLFLPFPGNVNKYILFHKTRNGQFATSPHKVYQSIIDITLDSGFGEVILKNDSIIEDTLNWGIAATKHGNGRDWWVIIMKDGNPEAYKLLITPNGLESVSTQSFNFLANTWGNASQITFSQDGTKFIYTTPINQTQESYLLIADFDRCSGNFANIETIQLTSNAYIFGLAFSPSNQNVYACTSNEIFQINTLTLNVDTVAIYDGFCYPNPPWCTTFFKMYLAANGKIYITTGNGTQHIHEINHPDSVGVACDVQQHNIFLNTWYFRAVPNHPNYYLGAVAGSVCDSLTSVTEIEHDFKFSVYPNPSNGDFNIIYMLPQNKQGKLEVFDITGKVIYEMKLPQWSTLQSISLPSYVSNGLYNCVITSDGKRVSRKIAVIRD